MSSDPGPWLVPERLEARHVRELALRYRQLSEQRQRRSALARQSRLLSLLALLIVVCSAGYLRYGALRLGRLTTAEVTVVDGSGVPVARLEATGSSASLRLMHGGRASASLESSLAESHLYLATRSAAGGAGVHASTGHSTTSLSLHHERGPADDSLVGYLSLDAHLESQISAHGRGASSARMTASNGRDNSAVQLMVRDVSNLRLASFERMTRVELGHAYATELALDLFVEPQLRVGRVGAPVVLIAPGNAHVGVQEAGGASLTADDNSGLVVLTDDRLKSVTQLSPTLLHGLGDGHPAELAP